MNDRELVDPKTCVVCRVGHRRPGTASTTLTRGTTTITIHQIPAELCDNCWEPYYDAPTADRLQELLARAIATGTRLAVLDYVAKVA